jgi:hypothetical protein
MKRPAARSNIQPDNMLTYLQDQEWLESKLKTDHLKRKSSKVKLRLKEEQLNNRKEVSKRRDWMIFSAVLLFMLGLITPIMIDVFIKNNLTF